MTLFDLTLRLLIGSLKEFFRMKTTRYDCPLSPCETGQRHLLSVETPKLMSKIQI